MKLREFPEQPGLAHPRLTDDRDHLPLTGTGLLQRLAELVQRVAAPHEAREPSGCSCLQPRACQASAQQFVHLEELRQPFHRYRSQGFDLDIALDQVQRVGREESRVGARELLHASG
jgi:hypothetical protein